MSSKRRLYPIIRRGGWDGQFTDPLTAFGVEWNASTWSISGGKVLNTPTAGAEKVTNGTMELDANWDSFLTPETNERSNTRAHSGTYARHVADATPSAGGILQSTVGVAGSWYAYSAWYYIESGQIVTQVYSGGGAAPLFSNITSTSGAWTPVLNTFMQTVSGTSAHAVFRNNSGSNPAEFYIDDVTLKPLTESTLYAVRRTTLTNRNVIAPPISTLTAATQAGIILALDNPSNPQNLVRAFCDGQGNIVVQKMVAGTVTTLATTATAHSATKYFSAKKNGSTWSLYYATTDYGAQIGTDLTINDAALLAASYVGMFSTYSSNQFNPASVYFQVKNYA